MQEPKVQPTGRGEPWALGSVLGYASAEILDRIAVTHTDPLIGPFLRGLPSLAFGVILVGKNRTWSQLRRGSPEYIGHGAVASLVLAGVVSTLGPFAYYFAIRIGGVVLTIPVLQTYALWGTLIAWFFLDERIHRVALAGIGLIVAGLATLSWGQSGGQPASPHWYWAIPLAFFTAFTYGIAGVLWRHGQLRGADQSTAIFLQFIASVTVGFLGLAVLGRGALILATARQNLAALVASGVLSGIFAIYCLFTALRLMAV